MTYAKVIISKWVSKIVKLTDVKIKMISKICNVNSETLLSI